MLFGYVRTSTKDQDYERQIQSLIDFGVDEENIFIDQKTGKHFDREGYQRMRKMLRRDDTVVIHELDRFVRNLKLGKEEVDWYERKGIKLIFLDMPHIHQMQESEDGLIRLMAYQQLLTAIYMCEKENFKRAKRQAEGIALAKAKGRFKGGKRKYTPENDQVQSAIRDYETGQFTINQICKERGMSRNTFYRRVMPLIKEREEVNNQKEAI